MKFHLKKSTLNEILLLICGFVCYFLVISLYVESLSNFITNVGVNVLPMVLLVRSVLFGVFSLFFVGISSRFRQQRIFAVLLLIFALFFALLTSFQGNQIFLTIYFYFITSLFFTFLDSGLILFASNFVNPIRAKSFLPLLSVATALGLITGSYFSANFNALDAQVGFGYIPACLLILVAILISALSKSLPFIPKDEHQKPVRKNFKQEIKQSIEYVFKTPIFRYLALATVLFICLQFFIEFKQNTILEHNILPQDLNTVLGRIIFAENILELMVSAVFVKRILFRFGVLNTMFLFAGTLLTAIGIGFLFQWSVIGIVIVYLTFTVLFFSCYQVAASQSSSLIPENLTQGVSFIFNQFGVAIASFVASCFLLLYAYSLGLESIVNTALITLLAATACFVMIKLRKSYQSKIQENIYSQNLFLQHRAIDLLAERAQMNKGENFLRMLLTKPSLPEEIKIDTILALSIIGNPESVADLILCLNDPDEKVKFASLQAIRHMLLKHKILRKYPFTKHQLLNAFKKIFVSSAPRYIKQEIMETFKYFEIDDIIEFLELSLKNPDKNVVMYTLETLSSFHDRSVFQYLKPFLDSSDPYLRSAAIVGLWNYDDFRTILLDKIGEILDGKTSNEEECAVFLIDRLNLYWEKSLLVKLLDKDGNKNALYALITLVKLGENQYIEKLLQKMIELEHKGEKVGLDLLLSKYRSLRQKTKNLILDKINKMSMETIHGFYHTFAESRYIFNNELAALKVE